MVTPCCTDMVVMRCSGPGLSLSGLFLFCSTRSQVHTHRVVAAKRLAAVGALARAVGEAVLHAVVAEEVAARLDAGILDAALADLTLQHGLHECDVGALLALALLFPHLDLLLQAV